MLAHDRHVVTGAGRVRVAQHDERALRPGIDEPDRRAQHDHTRSFGPHERLGDVEALLRQQPVQVEAGHPPGDVGVPGADRVVVAIAQVAQAPIDRRLPVVTGADPCELGVGRRAHPHAVAVVGEHVELDHLIGGERSRTVELGHHRVDAAGVVPDHPAESVAIVGGRIGAEREPVLAGRPPEVVEIAPRLDHRELRGGVDRADAVEVFREVDDDGDVRALAREARAATATRDRDPAAVTCGDRRDHVVDGAGHDDADRDLAVVGGVGRVRRAAPVVEAHLAGDRPVQLVGERAGVGIDTRRDRDRGDGVHRREPARSAHRDTSITAGTVPRRHA